MKLRVFLLLAMIISLAGFLFHQRQIISDLEAENAALRRLSEELERLRAENPRVDTAHMGAEEAEKLKRDHSELLRLRGEVGRLKRQLETAAAQTVTNIDLEEAAKTFISKNFVQFTTNFATQLQNRETLVTGRWEGGTGKQTFVFVTPQFVDAAGNELETAVSDSQVLFKAGFLSIPMDKIDENVRSRLASDRLSVGEFEELLKDLKESENVAVVAGPRVITGNQRPARISQIDMRSVLGTTVEVGSTVTFLPRISADGKGLDLGVQVVFTQEREGN